MSVRCGLDYVNFVCTFQLQLNTKIDEIWSCGDDVGESAIVEIADSPLLWIWRIPGVMIFSVYVPVYG